MERIQEALKKAREQRDRSAATHMAPAVLKNSDDRERLYKSAERDIQHNAGASHRTAADVNGAMSDEASASKADRALWQSIELVQPSSSKLEQNRIVTYQNPTTSTPFDVLRTKILHQMRKNNWTRVAVTSPSQGGGKSTTVLNLAFSLARQVDLYTMVVEIDLRRPSLSTLLGLQDPPQFSRALLREDDVATHLRRYGQNLIFGLSHHPVRNPAELLHGSAAARSIDKVEAEYRPDIILFDTAPVLAVDDTLAFMDQVDCVLLLAEAEKTTIEEIEKCEKELSLRTNFLGVILNKCRYLDRHDDYGKSYY